MNLLYSDKTKLYSSSVITSSSIAFETKRFIAFSCSSTNNLIFSCFSARGFRFLHDEASYTFYPRDAMLARVIEIATCLSVRLSVCPSVCPSITRRYCVKTKKASGMISSPSGSPKTLVFRRQISSPNSKGFPRTGASNKGRSEKFSDF